jgi:hypothetical protein
MKTIQRLLLLFFGPHNLTREELQRNIDYLDLKLKHSRGNSAARFTLTRERAALQRALDEAQAREITQGAA